MKNAKKIFCLVFFFLFPVLTYGQSPTQDAIQINTGWKFIPKDDLAFARPDYDDSNWKDIRVDKSWDDRERIESIGFNQEQAVPIIKAGDIRVYKKELADGNVAIGIFNLGEETKTYSLNLRTAGFEPPCKIRDLWRQKDLGSFKSTFNTIIPEHGVTLVKIFKEE
ncbi:hypothetical protein ACX8XN_01510 [Calditrichota bacterium GD2]